MLTEKTASGSREASPKLCGRGRLPWRQSQSWRTCGGGGEGVGGVSVPDEGLGRMQQRHGSPHEGGRVCAAGKKKDFLDPSFS